MRTPSISTSHARHQLWRAAFMALGVALFGCEPGRIGSVDGSSPDARHIDASRFDADHTDASNGCDAVCPANASCRGDGGCVCNAGYHLATSGCVADVDPCSVVTCSGHGHCVNTAGVTSCACDPGFTPLGTACVADVSHPCDGVSCSGHGVCSVVGGAPQCACNTGYHAVGADCVPDGSDPCAAVTCSGHGTCAPAGSGAACVCESGYHAVGLTCAPDSVDPCAGVACSGHGRCAVSGGVAVCMCDAGFRVSGLNCVSTTGPDPCAGVTCDGNGTCLSDRGRAFCHCNAGFYQSSGLLSCQPVSGSVCATVSCGANGTCAASGSAFGVEAVCTCDPGYVTYGTACVVERILFCRDAGDMLVPRGSPRCSADSSHAESCYDADGDGLLEWADAGITCPAGACTAECLNQDCSVAGCPRGGACMDSLDHMHVGLCVPSCDCGNCGSCGAGGSFVAFQAFCGNPSGAPAVTACRSPCPGVRDGCIPNTLSPGGFCFTDQGCFSAPP